jgi:hypothetical protein
MNDDRSAPSPDEFAARRAVLAGLSELVDRLGRSPASALHTHLATPVAARPPRTPMTAPLPPLKAVTTFKGTWSRLRAEQRLRQALAQVPPGAGPLNTSQLVNRALQAMRDLSPDYLDAFMSHVDTLQWLEQASGAGDLARSAAPADARRRPATRAARKG